MLKNLLILFCFCFAVPCFIFGQYSLQEFGVCAGAGISIPMEQKGTKMALGAHGKVFFSHYACGKRYGIHADLGVRSSGLVLPWESIYSGPGDPIHVRMNWVDGGFYFKIRLHEYHRPVESAFLAGVKLSYSPFIAFEGKSQSSSYEVQFNRLQPGVHLSVWFKRKIGTQSVYFQPGIEYYPFHMMTFSRGIVGGQVSGMYIFIGAGYSLWNSKHRKISRG